MFALVRPFLPGQTQTNAERRLRSRKTCFFRRTRRKSLQDTLGFRLGAPKFCGSTFFGEDLHISISEGCAPPAPPPNPPPSYPEGTEKGTKLLSKHKLWKSFGVPQMGFKQQSLREWGYEGFSGQNCREHIRYESWQESATIPGLELCYCMTGYIGASYQGLTIARNPVASCWGVLSHSSSSPMRAFHTVSSRMVLEQWLRGILGWNACRRAQSLTWSLCRFSPLITKKLVGQGHSVLEGCHALSSRPASKDSRPAFLMTERTAGLNMLSWSWGISFLAHVCGSSYARRSGLWLSGPVQCDLRQCSRDTPV